MSDVDQYARFFPVGIKVGVGIPMPNARVFNDWAFVKNVDEDLMTLQLSRDVLPSGVSLRYGQILEIRGGTKGNSYCCRAIIASWGAEGILFLRLIGEIVSDELREFYRIDAFLPIKYYVSQDQNIDRLRVQREERRLLRQRLEIEKNDARWDGGLIPHDEDTLPHEMVQDQDGSSAPHLYVQEEDTLSSWDDIIPLAANISGGGVRMITHQGFESGEYVLLELLVPQPQRLVDVIARVVFANRINTASDDHNSFSTGMQYVYIDESDRDAIVNYVSSIQQKRIRQMRESYLYRNSNDNTGQQLTDDSGNNSRKMIILSITILVVFMLAAITINYFWKYMQKRPKGEIEKTFEEEIKKKIEMSK
ncbi:MAG TPA: DUF5634 family protein [Desulfuromonadales bacterium]|nr:DUF5634 family protein [Desulfuromonadales bacterium]